MDNTQLEMLNNNWVELSFTRKDGTIKETVGTRNNELIKSVGGYIPKNWIKRGRAEAYFDKEDGQVKSFLEDNLISIIKKD